MAEGIVKDNRTIRRTEDIMTPELLKKRFLFGVSLFDADGNELDDTVLQDYIDMATSMLEHDLDIHIAKRVHAGEDAEEKDYQANDYWQWGYFQLNNIPVVRVTKLEAVYPNASILSYPAEWVKLQKHDGLMRIIPTAGTLSQFAVDNGGQYFPEIFRNNGHVPLVWRIEYESGFDSGKIPMDINAAIGLLAAIFVLNIMGDLVVGAGISGQSISLDGLSQSLQTTANAGNHAYSAKVKEYSRQLFGDDSPNSKNRGLISNLRDFYQGAILNII